jgi:hypothetical protein
VIARDRLAAAHAEALAEFGELVCWHVETLQPRITGAQTASRRP